MNETYTRGALWRSGAVTKTRDWPSIKTGFEFFRTLVKFVYSMNETYSRIKCSVAEYFPDESMWCSIELPGILELKCEFL